MFFESKQLLWFLASDGIILQSVHQSYFNMIVCGTFRMCIFIEIAWKRTQLYLTETTSLQYRCSQIVAIKIQIKWFYCSCHWWLYWLVSLPHFGRNKILQYHHTINCIAQWVFCYSAAFHVTCAGYSCTNSNNFVYYNCLFKNVPHLKR